MAFEHAVRPDRDGGHEVRHVDNLTPERTLQEIGWRYHVPYVDVA